MKIMCQVISSTRHLVERPKSFKRRGKELSKGRHDTQHNDIQHTNKIHGSQQNDIQHNCRALQCCRLC
jgi:hypothetical protein